MRDGHLETSSINGRNLALIIGLSTLFFAVIMSLTGYFDLLTLGIFVGGFNVVQWLISPYLINAMYRAKEISQIGAA